MTTDERLARLEKYVDNIDTRLCQAEVKIGVDMSVVEQDRSLFARLLNVELFLTRYKTRIETIGLF